MDLCLTQNYFQPNLLHIIYLRYIHLNLAWVFKHSFPFRISDQYAPRISHFSLCSAFPLPIPLWLNLVRKEATFNFIKRFTRLSLSVQSNGMHPCIDWKITSFKTSVTYQITRRNISHRLNLESQFQIYSQTKKCRLITDDSLTSIIIRLSNAILSVFEFTIPSCQTTSIYISLLT